MLQHEGLAATCTRLYGEVVTFGVSIYDGLLLPFSGLSFVVAIVLWTEGTTLITAAESGLLGSAEVPLAIFMAWVFLAEVPPLMSFIGGVVVLCAVLWHAVRDYRQAKSVLH